MHDEEDEDALCTMKIMHNEERRKEEEEEKRRKKNNIIEVFELAFLSFCVEHLNSWDIFYNRIGKAFSL